MKFKPDEECFGDHLEGYVNISPAKMVKIFGKPHSNDGPYKTAAEWGFISDDGHEVSVYDYKHCRNYTGDKNDPTASQFLNQKTSYEWHIGAKNKKIADEFIKWILKEVG